MSIEDKPQDSFPRRNSSPTQGEARLRALIEHSREVSLLLDDQGTILYASPALTHVLGYLPEEVSGQAMLSWVHPFDQSEASENLASLQTHARQELFTTQRYRHKDSSWRWLELRAVNKLADPQIAAFICSLRDITTLKEAETERKLLERLKDNFLSMVSHELKTPVTSIKGYTQLLQKHFQRSDEKQSLHFLAKMNYQLDKLVDLINEMLNISQLDLGMLNLRPKIFDLVEVAREELENQQATTATHRLQLKGVEKLTITGDRDRIGQVIHHLVSNAIKYSPGRKQVLIEISCSEQTATLHVQDFGIGIAEEHFSQLFERFYRVDEPLEQTFPGLGIGLYLAHKIIQRHQGHIWVESQRGQGSTFSFSLPR